MDPRFKYNLFPNIYLMVNYLVKPKISNSTKLCVEYDEFL